MAVAISEPHAAAWKVRAARRRAPVSATQPRCAAQSAVVVVGPLPAAAASRPRRGRRRGPYERAIQRAEKGLAAASAEGFREALLRVRQAVLQCERLVVVLDRPVLQGFRRRQSTEPLAPSDVEPAIQAVRAAVGSLAVTTPLKFSADYKRYTERVEALIEVGRKVLDRRVESSVKVAELDESKPFREP